MTKQQSQADTVVIINKSGTYWKTDDDMNRVRQSFSFDVLSAV